MVDGTDGLVLKLPLDSAAVGRLYDTFYDAIHRYCLRRLYFGHLAEDAVSEIFLTMAQRHGQFHGRTLQDFQAWLYVIAANQVNQIIRQKIRSRRMLNALAEQAVEHKPGSREKRWAALYQALLTLNEEEQHLIGLRFFQGFSHDEIARLVGRRAGAVRVKIHRALKGLRPTLERILDDWCAWENSDGH
jgi:RNA polymerase sigma factor (sigma-70 family)